MQRHSHFFCYISEMIVLMTVYDYVNLGPWRGVEAHGRQACLIIQIATNMKTTFF